MHIIPGAYYAYILVYVVMVCDVIIRRESDFMEIRIILVMVQYCPLFLGRIVYNKVETL